MINISIVELVPSLFLEEDKEEQKPDGGEKNFLMPLNEILVFHIIVHATISDLALCSARY